VNLQQPGTRKDFRSQIVGGRFRIRHGKEVWFGNVSKTPAIWSQDFACVCTVHSDFQAISGRRVKSTVFIRRPIRMGFQAFFSSIAGSSPWVRPQTGVFILDFNPRRGKNFEDVSRLAWKEGTKANGMEWDFFRAQEYFFLTIRFSGIAFLFGIRVPILIP